ncbi:hypothetical protein BH09SUM1_BH09SUM1_18140 [soil metagenome]
MLLKDFEHDLALAALNELWREWTALGVAGSVAPSRNLVIDPEALLAATMTLGRRDPRLFDEVIDWLTVNGDLINLSRLKRIMRANDSNIGNRAFAAISQFMAGHANENERWATAIPSRTATPEIFFQDEWGEPLPGPRNPDAAFKQFGILREKVRLRKLSQPFSPNGQGPLLLQLRALFGIGSRCEILCLLATHVSISVTEAALLTAYAPRTIHEVLSDMARAGAIVTQSHGKEIRYSLKPGAFGPLLPKSLNFPPSLAILSAIGSVYETAQECRQKETTPAVAVALLRRKVDSAAKTLARSGIPTALADSVASPPVEFLVTLRAQLRQLIAQL